MKNTIEKITLDSNDFRAVLIDKSITGADGKYRIEKADLGWQGIGSIDSQQGTVTLSRQDLTISELRAIANLANTAYECYYGVQSGLIEKIKD